MTKTLPKHKNIRKVLRSSQCYNPEKLKIIREENKLSRTDVVNLTGVAYATLDGLENGRIPSPEFTTMCILAELYNRSLDDFTDRPQQKYWCSETEMRLIQVVRKYPNFNMKNLISILSDQTEFGEIIRQLMRDILQLPRPIVLDYYRLSKDIIQNLKQQNQQKIKQIELINNTN